MKARVMLAALTLTGFGVGLAWSPPAQAVGCLSGGVMGAVAGHMANHGVLGAVGGCIAGHEYNKHKKAQATQSGYQQDAYPGNNPPMTNNGNRTQ